MTFRPDEHMLKLKSKEGTKDYLPVQWRLVWFREQCPGGTIDTEELQVDLDREVSLEVSAWNNEARRSEKVVKKALGYARYKAVVTDGKGGRATGTKSESAVKFPDYIEKAETGAIGRALAALGYGTQFTGDELDEGVERLADAPVEQKPSTNGQALHALTAKGPYEKHHGEALQATNHHDLPTIRELQDRCNRVIGSGMWQTWLHKALKIEDDELVLQDDELTPNDRERIAASLDYAEEQKKKAKVGK